MPIHRPVSESGHALVLFDGVCNLCNAAVNFVIDRDPRGYFKFAALQSEEGRRLLERYGPDGEVLESLVVVEAGRVYRRSAAALRIARRLNGLWPVLYVLMLVPRPLRDAAYRFVARRRYRWFGRREACRVSTPELAERFL